MLYHLLYPLHELISIFNVFRYITIRTVYAILTALLISFVIGPWIIEKLRAFQIKQVVREDVPSRHLAKNGTPTMGGSLILMALLIPTLLWADLKNPYIWIVLLTTLGFGTLGFLDDYKKIRDKNGMGIKARYKFPIQLAIGLVASWVLFNLIGHDSRLIFPFFKRVMPNLGGWYILFGMFVIVGTANAVNLTDGLDGLAIGPVLIASGTFILFCYLAGHYQFASYLQIPFVKGSGELTVLCGALLGSGLGFLWFNTYPAQVFMGDVGSLALGAALGTIAVVTKQEFLLAIVGGIFVVETLSVIIQVISFKLRKKRVFRMAPIHHHFELKGWAEPKIIVRFWIIAIILGLIAIGTLKLR
ncbi:MAG: phospho-N-acetylmuramoyl-pentapeptide-transferase [Deltaproteobacteria bacterium]|nr:phospho-N-acetylmuramoyl-pentapeptide-transferase [Deltaproteobacteria bacterium]MBM4323836.1 phospho-N-acetylmuramoyl-pentapeptide-transferase [Deltaproteobacteria bacterium]MBM4346583.1 phospho-N-acetylmuramoyl-pentapeptide-transferase [Deltaproteobacteria bacterium]